MRFVVFGLLLFLPALLRAEEATPANLDALVKQLGHENFDKRAEAEKELLTLGKPVAPGLQTALAGATDPEIKGRLQGILDTLLPVLTMTAEVDGDAKVGQPVKFRVRIKNVGTSDKTVVQCLDGSTRSKRYPYFSRTITPSPGPTAGLEGCGNCNGINANDLKVLKPGEDFNPFGPNSFGSDLAEWKPSAAGKFTLTFTCDYNAKEVSLWNGPVERRGGLTLDGLSGVPKVKLEASVEVDVKP